MMLTHALAAMLWLHTPTPACEYGDAISCVQVVRVHDGDTFVVDIPNTHPLFGRAISVRVRGIDAPEMHGYGPCEKQRAVDAQLFVAGLLAHAQNIRLLHLGRDKYFRILADVEVDGIALAEDLLKRGLACRYNGKRKPQHDWCAAAPCDSTPATP